MAEGTSEQVGAEAPEIQIAHLQAQHTIDVAAIADLEAVQPVDQNMIEHLEADGVLDRGKIADREAALVSYRRIGAALGVIMATQKITEEQAFQVFRGASQSRSREMRDITDDVL